MAINMNNVHSAAAMCDDQEIAGILNRLEALVTDDPETEERAALEAAMREEQQRREDEFCLLSSSGFPRRALHALDTLPDGETPWKAARRRVSALVKTPGAIVALHGPCGTGKTVMASSIARGLTRLGRSCRYSKAYDFCLALRQDEKAREKGVMSRFKRPYFLVLDEFHELKRSDFAAYSIDRLVDARFQAGKPTCIISNLRAEEVEPALGPAIVSRMHEAGGVITCEWASFRELREEAEQGG